MENIVRSELASYDVPNLPMGQLIKDEIDQIILMDPARVAMVSLIACVCVDTLFQVDTATGAELSYEELRMKAISVCYALVQNGLDKDDMVMFFGDNCLEYAIALVAIIFAGVTLCPSRSANEAYETFQQMQNCGARILMVTKSRLSVIEKMLKDPVQCRPIQNLKLLVVLDSEEVSTNSKLPKILTFAELIDLGPSQSITTFPYYPVDVEKSYFCIFYTSGTTGLPKGAIHNHRAFVATMFNNRKTKEMVANHGGVCCFLYHFGHVSGLYFWIMCIFNQMTAILIDHKLRTEQIFHLIGKHHCTCVSLYPEMAIDLFQNGQEYLKKYNLSSIRTFAVGGSKYAKEITVGIKELFQRDMMEFYGSTEMMGVVADLGEYEPGNVGSLLPNVEMKILDVNSGTPLPANQEGEICFRGPMCFVGYLNNEEATRQVIDQEGWYHTGDIGYYDEKRCLFITDRLKELIKYKYWSIGPAEIENFLETHPKVAGVCVVGVKHSTEGNHLRAYVELREGLAGCEKELADYVRGK